MEVNNFKTRWNSLQAKSKELLHEQESNIKEMQDIAQESQRVADVAANSRKILSDLDEKFEKYTGLTGLDIKFLFLATSLQIVRQYIVTQFPERVDNKTAANNTMGHIEEHSNRVHRYYHPSFEEIWTNPVPFDANVGSNGTLAGGGSLGHRVTAIGHDPILGLVFGTANIATSTLTNDRLESYHIMTVNKRDVFRNKAQTALVLSKTKDRLLHEGVEGKKIIGASLIKEIIHLNSDIGTKHSLPLPFISIIDARLASSLAERGLDMANIVTVGKQAAYSIMINTIISMIHGLFYDESMDRKLYEVRTRKILSYSNLIASTSNLIFVGANIVAGNKSGAKYLDIGGLTVTVYRMATDASFIRRVKEEFIEREFLDMIRGS